MAKEDFERNVRKAHRELFEKQRAEHPLLDPDSTARLLKRAGKWLNADSIAGFDSADFSNLSAEQLGKLSEAVRAFLAIVHSVSPDGGATEAQFIAGRDQLRKVGEILREADKSEWLAALDQLLKDCEGWSRHQGWEAKRDAKEITDDFLSRYEAPVLLIHSPQGRLLVDPVARYTVGGEGRVDLCVMPSFESAWMARDGSTWSIQADFGDRSSHPLSEETFIGTAKALIQRA